MLRAAPIGLVLLAAACDSPGGTESLRPEIQTATWGLGCPGVQQGNITDWARRTCSGRNCALRLSVAEVPDPSPGCRKGMHVTWKCPSESAYRTTTISDEAYTIPMWLNCPPTPANDQSIEVTYASYGENCGAPWGNVTTIVAHGCNTRYECDYEIVGGAILGDPAFGCEKDFRVAWRCSAEGSVKQLSVPAEAGRGGKRVKLECP
jgi:hypothetical protein